MTKTQSRKFNGFAIGFFLLLITGFLLHRANNLWQMRQWNYQGRFVVVYERELTVISYPADIGDIIEIKLSGEGYVDVPFDYGSFRLKDVRDLSYVERKDSSLFLASVASMLGLPVNGTSDRLTYADRLAIAIKKRNGSIKRRIIDLTSVPIFNKETRPDNTVMYKVDPGKVDYYLADVFWEKNIKEENLAIGIFNASGQSGIATSVERKLEKIGIRVVEVGNWDKNVKTCELHAGVSAIKSVTYQRLAGLFNCTIVTESSNGRFDLWLIIEGPI